MKLRLAILALALATPASAQRSLHWSDLQVDAKLDADGTLHVTERQTIVFSGDWNGGERRFDIRPRQRLDFEGMVRIDSAGGVHEMSRGSLANVDGYDFTDWRTLRWRSRLPSDPPFDNTTITYELAYSLSNILVFEGNTWVLDHDFAFANRDGFIEKIQVRLTLDSAWQHFVPSHPGAWRALNLPPGEGYVLRVPLRHVGTGDGPAVPGADPAERGIIAVVALLLLASIGKRLYSREKETGRLDPLPSPDMVNEKWLEENVFSRLPEVVGAAWDNSTGASEVAAILARLVGDGRLRSDVKEGGKFSGPILHLELLVDRSRFHGYEQKLIDALFEPGETKTDTASIRERYKKSGFDPAEKIKKPLTELVKTLVPGGGGPRKAPALPSLLAFLFGVALLVAGVANEPADAPFAVGGGAITLVCYFFALGGAIAWRNRVHGLGRAAVFFLIPLAIPLVALMALLASGVSQASALTLAGLTVLYLALANSIFNQARSRENLERIALRRRLAVARSYFINELDRDTPRLKDAWFPYLIAFGLGKQMDKWFAAFGGQPDPALATVSHSSGGSSYSGSSSSGGWSGFGGGGGFSGGGASASWAAAAGSIAAGVSAPSSSSGSSGGGGGGGGGSSGGGGGGGW